MVLTSKIIMLFINHGFQMPIVLKVMWKMVCVYSFQVGPGFREQGCISPWRSPRTTLLLHLRESPHAFPLFKQSLSCLFARCYHRDHVEIESFLNLLIASEGSTAAVTELVRYIFCLSCLAKLYLLNCALILLIWVGYCSFIANFP